MQMLGLFFNRWKYVSKDSTCSGQKFNNIYLSSLIPKMNLSRLKPGKSRANIYRELVKLIKLQLNSVAHSTGGYFPYKNIKTCTVKYSSFEESFPRTLRFSLSR